MNHGWVYTIDDLANNEYNQFCIEPTIYGNWKRYINHSCDPNTNFVLQNFGQRELLTIRAAKEIVSGEDITLHYGDEYFDNRTFRCSCGAEKCQLWEEGQTGKGPQIQLSDARATNDPALPAALQADSNATQTGKRRQQLQRKPDQRRKP